LLVVRALVLAGIWCLGVLLGACLLDRWVGMPRWMRVGLLAVNGAGVVWMMILPVRGWLKREVDWVGASEEIEGRDGAMGERLVTVVSQLLAPERYRGSEQMLGSLVNEVTAEVSVRSRGRLSEHGVVAMLGRPVIALMIVLMVGAILWPAEWLNLPQLLKRQVMPFAGTPPVTTTLIELWPMGEVDVKERDAVSVRAVVRRLGEGEVPVLYSMSGQEEWTRTPMIPTVENTWMLTLSGLDRDVKFYVKAGDARSKQTKIRVLKKPGVAEFRVRYAYPSYTGRAALATHNTDGLIEAPQGTEAMLSVVATEPLSSAILVLKGEQKRVELLPTNEANIRQGKFTVARDQAMELEMVSERGVKGAGPVGMVMRSVADRPPLVRIIQPATDLRLAPREMLALTYQALDDYGVANLTAMVQVNAGVAVEHALVVKAEARRVEDLFEVDLAKLSVKVGDVVTIVLRAVDRAGQKSQTEARHVLISPRSVDVATHQRLAELATAYDAAKDWADALAKAQEYLERARRIGPEREGEYNAAAAKVTRQLAGAQESAAALKQSLLRAIMVSGSAKMSDAIVVAIDQLTMQSDYVERIDQALMARKGVDETAMSRMTRSAGSAKDLAQMLKAMAEGEQAAATLADRGNLKASAAVSTTNPADKGAIERRRQMVERARQEISAALDSLKINPKDKEAAIDQQLQARVEAAQRVMAGAKAVDLVGPANKWTAGLKGHEAYPMRLDERLYNAAQAEALRPDAELVAARDLNLSARAVVNLSERWGANDAEAGAASAEKKKEMAELTKAIEELPAALAALRAEHEINRRALGAKNPAEAKGILESARPARAAASEARAKMLAWATGPGVNPDELAARSKELEELAMAANAAMATKNFTEAANLDQKLAAGSNKPEIAHAGDAPRAIDALSQNQQTLAEKMEAADEQQAAAIAGAQKKVADELAGGEPGTAAMSDNDSRQRATAAITAAQEKLASLPMQLSTAESMASAVADLTERLAKAKAEAAKFAATGSDADREMADRIVQQAEKELEEASASAMAARKAVGTKLAEELSEGLRPFAPEASAAVNRTEERLKPALAELQKALEGGGGGRSAAEASAAIEAAMALARGAIQEMQEALREAQSQVIERDPLVSARWFARAAADALTSQPPRKGQAQQHQRSTIEALGKAGLDAQRRSKNLRLAQVPGFSQIYLPPAAPAWGDGSGVKASERLMQAIPGLREWGRLRDRLGDSLTAPIRESDPPGYSDSLRVYFELLGREGK